jgi:hypothetical protein
MKKLSLDLDQLTVESFDTSTEKRPAGTVRAHGYTDTSCDQIICDCGPTHLTCDTYCEQATCGDSCGQDTCGDSCVNICPPTYRGEHSCAPPSCFYTCICP